MTKRNFATPIDEKIQTEFKTECKRQGFKMNEVIEILMNGFIKGDIRIERKTSYIIHQKEK